MRRRIYSPNIGMCKLHRPQRQFMDVLSFPAWRTSALATSHFQESSTPRCRTREERTHFRECRVTHRDMLYTYDVTKLCTRFVSLQASSVVSPGTEVSSPFQEGPHIGHGRSALGLGIEHALQEMYLRRREGVRILSPGGVLSPVVTERQLPGQHIVQYGPQREDVHLWPDVRLLSQDLCRSKVYRSAEPVLLCVAGPLASEPPVTQEHVPFAIQKYVFGLDVPVNEPPLMCIGYGLHELFEYLPHLGRK